MTEKTIQQVITDTIKDAETLEQAVNGPAGELIKSRLGREFYTLASIPQINTMTREEVAAAVEPKANKVDVDVALAAYVGGRKAYTTLALAQAAQSSLPANTAIEVTNDPTASNNGTYQWNGTTLTKSAYDPLTQAKGYTDTKTQNIGTQSDALIATFLDKNGNAWGYVDSNGNLFLVNITDSVQANLNALALKVSNIATNNDNLLDVKTDAGGQVYAYTDKSGVEYRTNDIVINNKSVLGFEQSLYANRTVAMYQNALQNKYPAVKNFVPVDLKSSDGLIKRIPFAIKTENGLLYFYQKQIAGHDGDFAGVEMWKALINIDANLNATVVSKSLFMSPNTSSGAVAAPMLGRTSDNRIIAIYVNRDDATAYPLYQMYSSDEGVSWTDPTLISPVGTSPSTLTIHGTTGAIVTARNGRLILPMYTGGGTCFCIYSDDDGITWHYSQWLAPSDGQGNEPSISMDLDDNLIMNIRPKTPSNRLFAKSTDNGVTWQPMTVSPDVPSSTSQGVIFRDKTIGAMMLAHATTQSSSRTKFRLMLSYDNGKSYPFYYQPFSDAWYGGYSQIIKWAEGIYIIVLEYADTYTSTNTNENVGLLILSLKEVLNNVSIN